MPPLRALATVLLGNVADVVGRDDEELPGEEIPVTEE